MDSKKSNPAFQIPSFSLRFVCCFGLAQSNGLHQPKLQLLMRKILLLLVFGAFSLHTFSQIDTTKKPDKHGWIKGGVVSFNLGQGGSRNWAAGAEKWSVSVGAVAYLYANKKMGKWSWDNSLDLGYAFINTQSQGYRKTDDKIYFVSKLGRKIRPKLDATILANFRSQFYDGFDYNYLNVGLKRRTSGFCAPAYVTLAPGIDWKPNPFLS